MSQIINIPAAPQLTDSGEKAAAKHQNLDITFGSENEDPSPEHRITSVKYKSAIMSQQRSKQLLEVVADNKTNEVESVNEQHQQPKLQMIISPIASIFARQLNLGNQNQKLSKPPQHSATKQQDCMKHMILQGANSYGVPEEESFEGDEHVSLPGDHSDLGVAKQKLLEMEERYNKITFKKVGGGKKVIQEAREEAMRQKKKKDVIERYNSLGTKLNSTGQDWSSSKMINLPNPVEKNESEEKEFNFKMRVKGSPQNKGQSRMSNFNTTKNVNWTASHEKNADVDLQNNSKVQSLSSTMYNTNHKFYNSRQQKFLQNQTPPIISNTDKYSTPGTATVANQISSKSIGHQFSSFEQAKKFRQRSLFEAANKQKDCEEITVNENADLDEMQRNQSAASIGTSPLHFGTTIMPLPGPKSVFKNSGAHLIGSRLNTTSKLADISVLPAPNNQTLEKLPLTWAEEQRIKKLINDYESLELQMEQSKEEDPLMKLKASLVFIQTKAMKLVQNYCTQDLCQLLDRGLSNVISLNQQKIIKFRNDLKFYEIEKMKHLKMIEERDKLIEIYRIRDLSEEEKQKLSWKERQERMDKYQRIDRVIDELFTEQAIGVQKVEPHYLVYQPIEEQEQEQEERTLNFRRMNWLEKDMELMMKLIQMDVSESYKIQTETNYEKHLNVLADTLKEGVDLGIQNQIANFHLRIEEILKENQRILKSKAPEKIDRCYQTDTWNMERYLDDLESLKRQKFIQDKELRDMKENMEKNKERIKKLKDDNMRLNKKISNMLEKERTIDQQLHDKDKQMQEIKEEALRRINESQKKEVEKAKEVKSMQEKYDLLNKQKVDREVEIMKREEEQSKKMDQMEVKLKEAKAAVNYFNKMLKKKEADLENTKEVFEMQLKIQSLIGSDNNSDAEENLLKPGRKGHNKKAANSKVIKEQNESRENDSNLVSVRRNSNRGKEELKINIPHKIEPPIGISSHSMNLAVPTHSTETDKHKPFVSPRLSSRRKSKYFPDNNLVKQSFNQLESNLSVDIHNQSAESKKIGQDVLQHQASKDDIKIEVLPRIDHSTPDVENNIEIEQQQQSRNQAVIAINSEDIPVQRLNDTSLRVSADVNQTIEAGEYNFMNSDQNSNSRRIKNKQLSIKIDQLSINQLDQIQSITPKYQPKREDTLLITTEEKSVQVDNPLIIYQPQQEKKKYNFQLPNSSNQTSINNNNHQIEKPVMMPEETQTTEQIPFDYINMILKYEEEKRKQSTHQAKALQKKHMGILPTPGQLAALQDLGNNKAAIPNNSGQNNVKNTTNSYYQGEFLANLENQLGQPKKNMSLPMTNNRLSMGPELHLQLDNKIAQQIHDSQKDHYAKVTLAAQQKQHQMQQQHQATASFAEPHGFPASSFHQQTPQNPTPFQQKTFQLQNQQTPHTTVEMVPVLQNQYGYVTMIPNPVLPGVPINKPPFQQQQQQQQEQQLSPYISQKSLTGTATFNPISPQVNIVGGTTTLQNVYRGLQQIPSSITEEDINNRANEQYSPSKQNQEDKGPVSNPNWMKTTYEMQQEAIQQTKKQIQQKITKNISVALNALVGKNPKNQVAVMENIRNMRNIQAQIEQADVKDEGDLQALNEIVKQHLPQQQVTQQAPSKKVSPPPRPVTGPMTGGSVQAPNLQTAQVSQMKQISFEGGQPISQSVGIGATRQSQLFKTTEGPQFVMTNGMMNQNQEQNQGGNNERSGMQSSKYTLRGETSQKEVRNSLQNVDLLEYYQKKKPQVGFQALLIGRPMSIEEVRLTSNQLLERSRSNSPNEKFNIKMPNIATDPNDQFFYNQDLPQDQMSPPNNNSM